MRKLLMAGGLMAAVVLGLASPATAEAGGASGEACGTSANGCEHALSNTTCAGNGGFTAYGRGEDFRGGADGRATGYDNSTRCGSPQGN